MSVDPDKVAALIGDIAETKIMSRYGKLAPEEVREKSEPSDFVTEVDEATERALRIALHGMKPDAAFIGEEVASREPAIMQALAKTGAAWVVDPLDGTRNFIRGVDEFGVIVALVENGAARMGWIYAAPTKDCAIAVAGAGATYNGAPFPTARPARERSLGLRSIGWLGAEAQDRMRRKLAAHFDTAPGHCSAYAYLKLARGDIDFKLSSRIHPWDHIAGALLLAELGGEVSFLDGGNPYVPQASLDAALLGVAPGRDWSGVADKLRD